MVFGRMCAVLLFLQARAVTLFFLRAVGALLESRDGEQRKVFKFFFSVNFLHPFQQLTAN